MADKVASLRTLNFVDEFSRERLAIRVRRKLNSTDVIDVLTDLFILRGPPAFVRSDNGPAFVAQAGRDWIVAVGARTACIEPGSPWENGSSGLRGPTGATVPLHARASTHSPLSLGPMALQWLISGTNC